MKAKQVNQIQDPNLDIEMVPFHRDTVEIVDRLLALAKKNGSKDRVQTSLDWDTIDKIYQLFKIYYPKTEKDFIEAIYKMRREENRLGVAREQGGAMIQHQLEVPDPLYRMILAIFPQQKWDKKFVRGLSQVLPQLKPINERL